jgi:hypothetical protein
MPVQSDLFVKMPEMVEDNVNTKLTELMGRFHNQELLMPVFQRDFVWSSRKVSEWAETIESGKAVGCIVTYQIQGGGPVFLADGRQRLTATSRYMTNPADYGFPYGPEQARLICASFSVTVQHRIYKNHNEAMLAFQNLNKGTALTMAEFYKGVLCLSSDVGEYLWKTVPEMVDNHIQPRAAGNKPQRKTRSSLFRDSLALFFQYVSDYKGRSFWNSHRTNFHNSGIEKHLRDYIDNERWGVEIAERKSRTFEQFILEQLIEIDALVEETDQKNKPFSRSVLHWLLHLAIWRKNNGRPVDLYSSFVKRFLLLYIGFSTFSARCVAEDPTKEEKFNITTGMGMLTNLQRLCTCFEVDLIDGRKRIQHANPRPGYNVSHKQPVALYGEGDTIIEPAPRNKARGAKEIEPALIA